MLLLLLRRFLSIRLRRFLLLLLRLGRFGLGLRLRWRGLGLWFRLRLRNLREVRLGVPLLLGHLLVPLALLQLVIIGVVPQPVLGLVPVVIVVHRPHLAFVLFLGSISSHLKHNTWSDFFLL